MIAIIDYGMGNLASVQKSLNFLGLSNIITNDHSIIRSSAAIILPGVGSFAAAMKNLEGKGLTKLLTEEVVEKGKKFLGICLGMQLIASTGTEPSRCKGLGWIGGEVVKLNINNLSVPHLGWNDVAFRDDFFTNDLYDNNFYFIHSYEFKVDNESDIIATVNYGNEIVAGVRKENILALQFHPEKSQAAGLSILKNYFVH
jgi:glutamine amidotransferase